MNIFTASADLPSLYPIYTPISDQFAYILPNVGAAESRFVKTHWNLHFIAAVPPILVLEVSLKSTKINVNASNLTDCHVYCGCTAYFGHTSEVMLIHHHNTSPLGMVYSYLHPKSPTYP
jgi:hypothetical protein